LHIGYPDLDVKQRLIPFAVKQLGLKQTQNTDLTQKLQNNNAVKASLNEDNLVGASIMEAMKKTKREMELQNPNLSISQIIDQKKDDFAKTWSSPK